MVSLRARVGVPQRVSIQTLPLWLTWHVSVCLEHEPWAHLYQGRTQIRPLAEWPAPSTTSASHGPARLKVLLAYKQASLPFSHIKPSSISTSDRVAQEQRAQRRGSSMARTRQLGSKRCDSVSVRRWISILEWST